VSSDNKAKTQLQVNLESYNQLVKSYEKFASASTNILGTESSSNTDTGGTNPKLVLDALPPAYDYPGLTSTLGKILTANHYDVTSIGGTDEELTQGTDNSSVNPTPVPMPFSIQLTNITNQQLNSVISLLQNSIRPIDIDSVTAQGDDSSLDIQIDAHTYYQPSEKINISTQAVQQ
jgi:hypothetical protein